MKTIYISGIIGLDFTADKLRETIDPKSTEKIQVIINSAGGLVSDGFEIYNILKAYKGDVEIIIGVMAASVASYISMVVPIEKRKGFRNSSMMIHEATAGIYSGRARDMKIAADRLEGINKIGAEVYAEGMNITKEDARALMSEDFYMTGWEALLENNVISDVIDYEDVDIPQKEEDEEGWLFFDMMKSELFNKNLDFLTVKSKIYQEQEKYQNNIEIIKKDQERMEAYFENNKILDKPDENKKGVAMSLKEFLKKNPEAQAEYETDLQSAREEGKIDGINYVNEMLSLKKDIHVPEIIIEGIKAGKTKGEVAVMMVEAQVEERKEKKIINFGSFNVKQVPGEQDPTGKKETMESNDVEVEDLDEWEEKARERLEKRGGLI